MTSIPNDSGPHGIVVIDKPHGWTSHDVVARSRKVLGTRKVGHAGTLDPDATGVLVLGVGRATRLLRFVVASTKSYVGEIVLGSETSTLDASGEVTARYDMSTVSDREVTAAAATLVGEIMQVPPMVSAVKIAGRRLHEIARQNKVVERSPRRVTVHRFLVNPIESGVWRTVVDCSSGTYVRVLAADLGTALGGGAHLRSLRRTAVGRFGIADACPVERPRLLPVQAAVQHLEMVTLDTVAATAAGHGRTLRMDSLKVVGDGPWAVHGIDGELIGVYRRDPTGARPIVIVSPTRGGSLAQC